MSKKKYFGPQCPDCGEHLPKAGMCYECRVKLERSNLRLDKHYWDNRYLDRE